MKDNREGEHPAARAESDLILMHGEGPGRAVLLHAAGTGPRSLDRLAYRLRPAVGQLLSPSFVQHGASMIGCGPSAFDSPVSLTRSLIEAEEEGPRFLIGHSMGGLIALLALSEGIKVHAAVLYEPIMISLLDPGDSDDRMLLAQDAAVIAHFSQCMSRGQPEAGISRFTEAYGDHPWSMLPERVRVDLVKRAPQVLAEATATNGARIAREALARIAIPILILKGSRSPEITVRMADRLATSLPHARVATVEGAGHMGPVTLPDGVADVILPLIGSVRSQVG
jgi:pimeloyl-ACP methyl ester carboxylesterase